MSTRALRDAVEDTAQVLSTLASSDSALVAKADRNSPLSQVLDSVRRTSAINLDSLSRTLRRDTTIAVSNAKALADSAKLDTTRQRSGLEAPVDYTAKDSLVYDATTGFAHLYGEAKVHYQNMDLSADFITLNMDSTIVHAQGVPDSTGKAMKGTPIYKQGSENYESERMSFNFKTKKGFIEKAMVSCAVSTPSDPTMAISISRMPNTPPAMPTIHTFISNSRELKCRLVKKPSSDQLI